MNNIITKESTHIEDLIYQIRGKWVMLDSDLAHLYKCKNGTKAINLAVKRNIERFPEDFYFQLTKEECELLRFHSETANNMSRTLPYAFTEQGVAMLSSVLRTEIASQMSVNIMRAFVAMKKYISANLIEQKYINNLVLKHDEDIKILNESFNSLSKKSNINEIYFNGQIFDAYFKIKEIFNLANKKLIIIDRYADISVLNLIKNLKINVILIVKQNGLLTKEDIIKYNKQYNNLKVIYDDSFHDRYFILDKKEIYHCGASINHAGNRTFSINKLEDNIVIKSLIDKINNITKSKLEI